MFNYINFQGSIYLFKALPLSSWKLTLNDLSFLEHLILNHPIASIENSLSRHVYTKLFSGCNENYIKYVTINILLDLYIFEH